MKNGIIQPNIIINGNENIIKENLKFLKIYILGNKNNKFKIIIKQVKYKFELKIKYLSTVSKNTIYIIDNKRPNIINIKFIHKIKIITNIAEENIFLWENLIRISWSNFTKFIENMHTKKEETNTPKVEPKNRLVIIFNFWYSFIWFN